MNKINEEFLQDYIINQNPANSNEHLSSNSENSENDVLFFKILQKFTANKNPANLPFIESLYTFYKIFTTLEVKSVEDLKNSTKEFEKFLMRNIHLLQDYSKLSKESILSNIDFAINAIQARLNGSITEFVERYSNIIKELFPNQKNMHLLDVGSGTIPYSAFLEGETFSNVSTMDYDFYLPNETMQNLNVNGIKNFFDAKTPITTYDAIVGKQPCSAIEHISRTCVKENKPYFIQLCNCNLPNKNQYIGGVYGWQDILPEFDPNVKFYEDYAFNLDASEEQVKKIIDKYNPKDEIYDLISFKEFAKQLREVKPQCDIPSNFWLQPDEVYEEPEIKKDDVIDFLQMEIFERS